MLHFGAIDTTADKNLRLTHQWDVQVGFQKRIGTKVRHEVTKLRMHSLRWTPTSRVFLRFICQKWYEHCCESQELAISRNITCLISTAMKHSARNIGKEKRYK